MYYFIINPNSRNGRGGKVWKALKETLNSMDIPYEAFLTEHHGHARKISQVLTSQPQNEEMILAVVGGDGTLNEVIDGLQFHENIAVGFIGTGSGNDFARGLKLPKNPHKMLKRIIKPTHYSYLDYGVVSYGQQQPFNRRFCVSMGIGFDADVCTSILSSKLKKVLNKLHLGGLLYIVFGLKQLICARPSNGYMVIDETKRIDFHNILFISAHIHKYEGGGFAFAPKADPRDGLLEICAVSNLRRRRLFLILVMALVGMPFRMKGMRSYRCKEIRIHTEKPMAVHVDGEALGSQTDIMARCIEKKVKLIV